MEIYEIVIELDIHTVVKAFKAEMFLTDGS